VQEALGMPSPIPPQPSVLLPSQGDPHHPPLFPSTQQQSLLTSLDTRQPCTINLFEELHSKSIYLVVRKLSSKGAFGTTYLVQRKEADKWSDKLFVLKKIKFLYSQIQIAFALREASWLMSHNIETVVKGYDCWGSEDKKNNIVRVFIVMEYVEGGDLSGKYPMKEEVKISMIFFDITWLFFK
jgi:serine/threonine protein kinase